MACSPRCRSLRYPRHCWDCERAGMRNVAILGATGSIGASALDVIARHPDRFRVSALAAHRKVDELVALCARFQPDLAVVADSAFETALRSKLASAGLHTRVASGDQG